MHDSDLTLASSAKRPETRERVVTGPELPMSASPPLAADAPRISGSAVTLTLHGELAAVEPEWRAFEGTADCTVFQTFDWLAKWQQHIGTLRGTVPAIVLGRDHGGLLFILPLAIETRGALRRLTWLGSDLCDYNAPLLASRFSDYVTADRFAGLWRDAVRLLHAEPRFRFDLVDLQKMPEMVGTQTNPFLAIDVRANPSSAYVATLGRNWDEFYAAKRSSATRKKERRQLKNLAEHGEVRFVDVKDQAEIARTLDTLIDQKSHAFARMGIENLFARPGYRAFYRDIATNVCALTHISRLDVGTTMAATSLGLKFRDCYYLVLSSYHDGEITRFGPGRAHLHALLGHAMADGFARFDFTIGDEPYKRDWSDIVVRIYDHLDAVTLLGAIVVAMTMAFRRTKRLIKQTPALWHAYSRLRGLSAMLGRR